jgi:hypothetical protein
MPEDIFTTWETAGFSRTLLHGVTKWIHRKSSSAILCCRGTRRFITVLKKHPPSDLTLSQLNPVHTLTWCKVFLGITYLVKKLPSSMTPCCQEPAWANRNPSTHTHTHTHTVSLIIYVLNILSSIPASPSLSVTSLFFRIKFRTHCLGSIFTWI